MERKYFELAMATYNRNDSVVDGITYTSSEKNEALRNAFKDLVPDGKNRYKSFRKNKNEIFELVEENVDEILPKRVDDAYGGFVEYQILDQGQKPKFKTKKGKRGLLNFITKVGLGGVIERTRLDVDYINMTMEAFGGAVYCEFEQFLDGIIDWTDLINAIVDGIMEKINLQIQSILIASFTGLSANMKVQANSFVPSQMGQLITNVQSYGDNVVIFCTPTFAGTIEETPGFVSDMDRTERREFGRIGKFRGASVIVLPNAFADDANTSKVLSDQYAIIVATNESKIVKVAFEGETIVNETENADRSIDFNSYKKFGLTIVYSNFYSMYKNTSL